MDNRRPNHNRKNFEYVYGIHATQQILKSYPETVLELWVLQESQNNAALREIVSACQQLSIAVHSVPRKTLDRLAEGGVHQGVVVRRRPPKLQDDSVIPELLASSKNAPFFLALEGLQDPHNFGACLRTADAVGVTAVIIPTRNSVGITSAVSKVATGAAETLTIIQVKNFMQCLEQLKELGLWVVGTSDQASDTIYDVDLTRPIVLVMGNEGDGLREHTLKNCDYVVKIPMYGQVESLNVSVAVGVCLYETVRQRMTKK